MTLKRWVENTKEYFENYPRRKAARASALNFWAGACGRLDWVMPTNYGTHVYDEDWDVLILLDACRPDILAEFNDEYSFLPDDVPTIYSRGSMSLTWMQETFTPENQSDIAETNYICGNAFSKDFGEDIPVSKQAFANLDEPWRDGWDDDLGTLPPREVTDRAIRTWRDGVGEKMILHYMQPHAPYRSFDGVERLSSDQVGTRVQRHTVWDKLQLGELDREEALAGYRDNLQWVLDDIEILLENIDADTVKISADHAELFGELGIYSHPRVPLPKLRRVPWVETTATDEQTYEPPTASEPEADASADVEQRLADLGYV